MTLFSISEELSEAWMMFRLCGNNADGWSECGAAVAVGGESEVAPSGSPVLTGESNLHWGPLRAGSPPGLSRKKENEHLELFSCCLSDAKGHVCSFPYGNYIAWLLVLTCSGHVCLLCVLHSSWNLWSGRGRRGGGMWANILSFVSTAPVICL